MIAVQIGEAAKRTGAVMTAAGSLEELRMELARQGADLIIADLAAAGLSLEALAAEATDSGVPLIGFYPHVNVALAREAREAGIQKAYPRSRFLRELVTLLQENLNE
jgi:hypothetical protein